MSGSQAESADRNAIVDVLHRYAHGFDFQDLDMSIACFTEDCHFHRGGQVTVGHEALMRLFADLVRGGRELTGLDTVESLSHPLSNIEISLSADTNLADVTSIATVYRIGMRDGDRVLQVRLVRYRDVVVRGPQGWRISERRHTLQWMYEVPQSAGLTLTGSAGGSADEPEDSLDEAGPDPLISG